MEKINRDDAPANGLQDRVSRYEQLLVSQYGPLLHTADLLQVAGYKTNEALRMAMRKQSIGFPIFSIAHRRGKFAWAHDVAQWLAALDEQTHPIRNPEENPMT
ncbi:MAG: hypothetical protein ACREPB_16410 [Arenimonas sp.]